MICFSSKDPLERWVHPGVLGEAVEAGWSAYRRGAPRPPRWKRRDDRDLLYRTLARWLAALTPEWEGEGWQELSQACADREYPGRAARRKAENKKAAEAAAKGSAKRKAEEARRRTAEDEEQGSDDEIVRAQVKNTFLDFALHRNPQGEGAEDTASCSGRLEHGVRANKQTKLEACKMKSKELGTALKACKDEHTVLTEKLQGVAQLKAKLAEAVARHHEDHRQAEARLAPSLAQLSNGKALLEPMTGKWEDLTQRNPRFRGREWEDLTQRDREVLTQELQKFALALARFASDEEGRRTLFEPVSEKWLAVVRHRAQCKKAQTDCRLATVELQKSCGVSEDLTREVEKITMSIATHEAAIAAHGVEENRFLSELADLPEEMGGVGMGCGKPGGALFRVDQTSGDPGRETLRLEEDWEGALRERYEALGPEGSFFFHRALGLEEERVGGELDADLV